jgi:twitching motility protein PilT
MCGLKSAAMHPRAVDRGEVDEGTALEVGPNPDALKMALNGIKVSQPGIL